MRNNNNKLEAQNVPFCFIAEELQIYLLECLKSQFFNEQETLLVLYSLPCFCTVTFQVILLNWECNTTLFKILESYFIKANIRRLLGEWEGNCFNCIKAMVMLISTYFFILALPELYANQEKLINPVNKHNNSFSCGIK